MLREYIKFQDRKLWKRSGSGWETLSFLEILHELLYATLLSAGMLGLILVDILLIFMIKGLLNGGVI